jgi:glycosyltransferase involved in cell wall biosynthesis
MTSTPLVSVVIATYNMSRYLPLAVESVLAQTYPHLELHIVDDGSTDGTVAVLERFASVPRVTCHRHPNGGQARAKNAGIRASAGDIVAFLDADDIWLPDKLAQQVPVLWQSPTTGVVYSPVEYIDAEGHRLPSAPDGAHPRGRIAPYLFLDNCIPFPTAIVRRRCLDEVGLFDESLRMSIDWDLWLRIAVDHDFEYLPRATALYRIWGGQMSHDAGTRFDCTRKVMVRFLEKHPGLLAPGVVAEAWAHTFTRYARRLTGAGRRQEAFGLLLDALRRRPLSVFAWKSLARLALNRRAT